MSIMKSAVGLETKKVKGININGGQEGVFKAQHN